MNDNMVASIPKKMNSWPFMDLSILLKARGFEIEKRVLKKTSFLFSDEVNSPKTKKALKLNIPIHKSEDVRDFLGEPLEDFIDKIKDSFNVENDHRGSYLYNYFGGNRSRVG